MDCPACHVPGNGFPVETTTDSADKRSKDSSTECSTVPGTVINPNNHGPKSLVQQGGEQETAMAQDIAATMESQITTETNIDITAEMLPSGGTQSHFHVVRTAVSETSAQQPANIPSPPSNNGGFKIHNAVIHEPFSRQQTNLHDQFTDQQSNSNTNTTTFTEIPGQATTQSLELFSGQHMYRSHPNWCSDVDQFTFINTKENVLQGEHSEDHFALKQYDKETKMCSKLLSHQEEAEVKNDNTVDLYSDFVTLEQNKSYLESSLIEVKDEDFSDLYLDTSEKSKFKIVDPTGNRICLWDKNADPQHVSAQSYYVQNVKVQDTIPEKQYKTPYLVKVWQVPKSRKTNGRLLEKECFLEESCNCISTDVTEYVTKTLTGNPAELYSEHWEGSENLKDLDLHSVTKADHTCSIKGQQKEPPFCNIDTIQDAVDMYSEQFYAPTGKITAQLGISSGSHSTSMDISPDSDTKIVNLVNSPLLKDSTLEDPITTAIKIQEKIAETGTDSCPHLEELNEKTNLGSVSNMETNTMAWFQNDFSDSVHEPRTANIRDEQIQKTCFIENEQQNHYSLDCINISSCQHSVNEVGVDRLNEMETTKSYSSPHKQSKIWENELLEKEVVSNNTLINDENIATQVSSDSSLEDISTFADEVHQNGNISTSSALSPKVCTTSPTSHSTAFTIDPTFQNTTNINDITNQRLLSTNPNHKLSTQVNKAFSFDHHNWSKTASPESPCDKKAFYPDSYSQSNTSDPADQNKNYADEWPYQNKCHANNSPSQSSNSIAPPYKSTASLDCLPNQNTPCSVDLSYHASSSPSSHQSIDIDASSSPYPVSFCKTDASYQSIDLSSDQPFPSHYPTILITTTYDNSLHQSTISSEDASILSTTYSADLSNKSTTICTDPTNLSRMNYDDPAHHSKTFSDDPAHCNTSPFDNPLHQKATTSDDPPDLITIISCDDPSIQSRSLSSEPAQQNVTSSVDISYLSSASYDGPLCESHLYFHNPPHQSTNTTDDPLCLNINSSNQPPQQITSSDDSLHLGTTYSHDPPHQNTTSSYKAPQQSTISSDVLHLKTFFLDDPPCDSTTSHDDPAHWSTTTTDDSINQSTPTSDDPADQITIASDYPPNQSTSSSNKPLQQIVTSPYDLYVTSFHDPLGQSKNLSDDSPRQSTNITDDHQHQKKISTPPSTEITSSDDSSHLSTTYSHGHLHHTTTSSYKAPQKNIASSDVLHLRTVFSADPTHGSSTSPDFPTNWSTTAPDDLLHQSKATSDDSEDQITISSDDLSNQSKTFSNRPPKENVTASDYVSFLSSASSDGCPSETNISFHDPPHQSKTSSDDPPNPNTICSSQSSQQHTSYIDDLSHLNTTYSHDPSHQNTTFSKEAPQKNTISFADPSNQTKIYSADCLHKSLTSSNGLQHQSTTSSNYLLHQSTTDTAHYSTNMSDDPTHSSITISADPPHQNATTFNDLPCKSTMSADDPTHQREPSSEEHTNRNTKSSNDPTPLSTTTSHYPPHDSKIFFESAAHLITTSSDAIPHKNLSSFDDPQHQSTTFSVTPPHQTTNPSDDPPNHSSTFSDGLLDHDTTSSDDPAQQSKTSFDNQPQQSITFCENVQHQRPCHCTNAIYQIPVVSPSIHGTASSPDPEDNSINPFHDQSNVSTNFSSFSVPSSHALETHFPNTSNFQPLTKPIQDEYGALIKQKDNDFLEESRKIFLNCHGQGITNLDSGIALTRNVTMEDNIALVALRDGTELGMVAPPSKLFFYYQLGKHFFITKQLSDNWFCAQDQITKVTMLMKKVLVTSNWMKVLYNFLLLPEHPRLLTPYAAITNRDGSIFFLMEDKPLLGTRTLGMLPLRYQVSIPGRISEIVFFLRYCKMNKVLPRNIEDSILYTPKGLWFDRSSLYNSDELCELRKCLKAFLSLFLCRGQQEFSPCLETLFSIAYHILEEDLMLQANFSQEGPIPFFPSTLPNMN